MTIILFNNRILSPYADFIDVAMVNRLVEVPERIEVWWWRFTICKGARKQEHAATVRDHVKAMQRLLDEHSGTLTPLLQECIASIDPPITVPQLLNHWKRTLACMFDAAVRCDVCEWIGLDLAELTTVQLADLHAYDVADDSRTT
jgi:hypothetical protein